MKKMNKKGFTIVELVIVIAVIAILAAVLIPTFSGVINKANQAKDTQLVRNLNTSLALDVDVKHNTMQDALDAVAKQGYDLDKINASAMQAEILWDSHNDAFVYLDGERNINYLPEIEKDRDATSLELWQICNEMPETQEYSIYAGNGWDVTSVEGLTVGFDAGKNTNITSVNYVNSASGQSVVIRTNGGMLTVNAPADTVNHYGKADSVNIVSIASASYHENGTVPFIQISKGRIEIEADGDVNGIHVANVQVVDSDGNISKTANTFTGDVVLTLNGNEVKLTRDTIGTNISEAVLVCAVDASDSAATEYIWLVGGGTIENSKVYVTATSVAPDTSTASTTTTENASAAAVAIANNATNTGTEEAPVYVAVEAGTSAENAQVASALKGTGTEADPFLVYDYETMQKISDFYDKGHYYFAVALEKTDNGTIDCSGWVPVKLNGSFNGKNVRFENVDSCLFSYVNSNTEAVTINNFTATMDVFTTNTAALVNKCIGTHDVLIENVNVSGKMVSLYATSGYIGWLSSSATNNTITFKNCINDATLLSSSNTVSGFVYHAYSSKASIIVDNSLVIGTTLSPNASASSGSAFGNVHSITGLGSTTIVKVKYTQEFINNYASYLEKAFATISSKEFVCLNITAGETTISSPNSTYMCDSERNRIVTINQTTNTLPNIGQGFTGEKAAGSSFAVVTLNIGPNGYKQSTNEMGTCILSTYEEEYVDLRNIEVGGTFESKEIKMSHLSLNGSVDNTGNVIDGLNNGWNIVNGQLIYNENEESSWTWIYSQYTTPNQIHTAYVQITQFDGSTNALSIVRYDLFSENVIQYTAYTN